MLVLIYKNNLDHLLIIIILKGAVATRATAVTTKNDN